MDSSTTVPVSSLDNEKGYNASGRPHATRPRYQVPILILRYLTFGATLSAFVVMITNKQTRSLGPLGSLSAKYHYSDAFMWFVIANCIAFIYALLTALLTTFSRSPKLVASLLLLDLLTTYIILAGAASATSVAYIGKRGLAETQWRAICDTFHRYCAHVLGALVASFLGFGMLAIATILSALDRHHS